MISFQGDGGALSVAPSKTFQSLVVSAPWLSTGEAVGLYRGGTVSGGPTGGLFDSGTLTGATLLETVSLSSVITAVTS